MANVAMIPPETLEQIAAANDIVELIGSYFPLRRAGATYKALCPFHQEKTPSFTVNPQRQIFKCFGCGAGGSVFRFVMAYENLDFPSAARKLADRAGIPMVEAQLSESDDKRFRLRKRLLALHVEAAEWFHQNLCKTEAGRPARDYLKARGINLETAKSWKLGFAPQDWTAFGDRAAQRGYSREEILASGLVKLRNAEKTAGEFYDRFRGRIMFPICNDVGEVIAFSGRVLDADAKEAKYVNSPETMLFTKGNVLFGLHKAKRALIETATAVVCEGQLDLITAFEAGVHNVTAPQGTAFTEKQARVLKRYVEEVVLCFDADLAGEKAVERSLEALLDANLLVRVAEMPAGEDPDSLIRKEGAEAFIERIRNAEDFFDFQIIRQTGKPEFGTPRGRLQFARKMAGPVALLSDPVLRESVIHRVTARLEVPAEDFRRMLTPKRALRQEATGISAPALSHTMRLLCMLGLREGSARQWLLGKDWRDLLSRAADAELLIRILSSDVRPDDPQSINAFMSGLDAEDESVVAMLLSEKMPAQVESVLRDCWRELERRELKRRQESMASRLRTPDLSMEEVARLQKEILDLQKRLIDIARPFSQPQEPPAAGKPQRAQGNA
jgi:DNA primase